MSFHAVVFQLAFVAAGLSCAVVGVYAFRRRDRRGGLILAGLLASILVWIAMGFLVLRYAGTPIAKAAGRAQYVGVVGSVLGFFLLSLVYTGREDYVTKKTVVPLLIEPVFAIVAAWVPPLSQQFVTYGAPDGSMYYGYVTEVGVLFMLHTFYSYLLLLVGAVLFLTFAFKSDHLYRRQILAVLVAAAAPWVGNVFFLFSPFGVDLTPVAFAVTGLALWWAMFNEDFLAILPVARSTVVDNIGAGVFVLDRQNHVVDINDTGRDLLDLEGVDVIGHDATELLAAYPEVRERFEAVSGTTAAIDTEVQFGENHYRVQISPLYDRRDALIGRLFLVNDITDQKRRQQELKRQNEQLEQFANVVSHDLRNPLNVASGRLELARTKGYDEPFETVDQQYLAGADDALGRMDQIIDDVLTLAREGRGIEETERSSLSTVAEAAWHNVATPDAALALEGDREFAADVDRLQRVFENLFRNAIDHGRDGVTVTVGATDDGFFVADDGPGIPEQHRDDVLDDGFTTDEEGTGFGLSIVESIVEAHGWNLAVGESESGGARFTIGGVPPVTEVGTASEQAATDD